ncbi:MAG: exonuclease domain-containing protein [Bacteroidota bacterium]
MFAITDIETTGGNALTDKITEIAIYIHDGIKVVDEYATLINPGRSIPPFVQNLTGITDDMVADAPAFKDVADEIRRFTEAYIFVAHSSQFDYSFIRQEFKSLGYDFARPSICTVSFSRKVMPGYKSYGLSSLCERHNIENISRHRATGDAFATVKLFEMLMSNGGNEIYTSVIKQPVEEIQLPDCIRPEVMSTLPTRAGLFYFLDKNEEILFIGRGSNIRKSIVTFITKTRHKKSFRIREELHDIRFEETGTEVLAAILEYYEWKKYQPRYNSRQTRQPHLHRNYSGSAYIVFKGRNDEEEVFIRLTNGQVTGFTYMSHSSQAGPEDLIIPLPIDTYTTSVVQRAISRKYYKRMVITG